MSCDQVDRVTTAITHASVIKFSFGHFFVQSIFKFEVKKTYMSSDKNHIFSYTINSTLLGSTLFYSPRYIIEVKNKF